MIAETERHKQSVEICTERIDQSHDDTDQFSYDESSCEAEDADQSDHHADFQQTYTCILSHSNT